MAIVENKSRGERIFNGVNIFILLLLTLIFFYPLWHCLMASFSDPGKLLANSGALLWPAGYSLRGYEAVLSNQNILTGYQNTLFYVIVGTSLSTVLTLVGAYALTRQGLMLKKPIMVMIVITMYIGGGMIPDFMVVSKLGLFDSRWSVILATAITTYNLMVMRGLFAGAPFAGGKRHAGRGQRFCDSLADSPAGDQGHDRRGGAVLRRGPLERMV